MTDQAAPLCMFCAHLNSDDTALTCTAYPDGIPARYLTEGAQHLAIVGDDNGIVYAPNDALIAEVRDELDAPAWDPVEATDVTKARKHLRGWRRQAKAATDITDDDWAAAGALFDEAVDPKYRGLLDVTAPQ